MQNEFVFKTIATVKSDFHSKFGIPRQSGLLKSLQSQIVFEDAYKNPDALRGLDGFSHLWLLWIFSENQRDSWKPTVRPPRLGGNKRLGVFATRSSFRPNPIALSAVKLEKIILDSPKGPYLIVSGADLMNGTPIVDIKPYLPYADSIKKANSGFAENVQGYHLDVTCPPEELEKILPEKRDALLEILSQDPRPAYKEDGERVYGFKFADFEISFVVKDGNLSVKKIDPLK
ncbi:MAG: tRNA (N6-threonylcarbamoyladenosine(37)-N6)-methyltransferase TrmO [Fibrobacteraceae bacterium]|nr:tRNA (N6-threonylcarbamoyladenosine(37)-N6)-methyltransferase TrmO [Fibrobacteraceae bacterium]